MAWQRTPPGEADVVQVHVEVKKEVLAEWLIEQARLNDSEYEIVDVHLDEEVEVMAFQLDRIQHG